MVILVQEIHVYSPLQKNLMIIKTVNTQIIRLKNFEYHSKAEPEPCKTTNDPTLLAERVLKNKVTKHP